MRLHLPTGWCAAGAQERAMSEQMELAASVGLPLLLYEVRKWELTGLNGPALLVAGHCIQLVMFQCTLFHER